MLKDTFNFGCLFCLRVLPYFYFLIEGRSIQSHAEKNKVVGERWRQMTEEEKEPYYGRAKEGSDAIRSQPEKSWKEASRIIRNMESNVCVCICRCCIFQ